MEASRGVDVGADLVGGEVTVIGDVEWQQEDVQQVLLGCLDEGLEVRDDPGPVRERVRQQRRRVATVCRTAHVRRRNPQTEKREQNRTHDTFSLYRPAKSRARDSGIAGNCGGKSSLSLACFYTAIVQL